MGETREVQLRVLDGQDKRDQPSPSPPEPTNNGIHRPTDHHDRLGRRQRSYGLWLRVAVYGVFVLAGQTTATLLGRLYFTKGGQRKWIATLVQMAGFPILIPFSYIFTWIAKKDSYNGNSTSNNTPSTKPSKLALATVYITLGLNLAGVSFLASNGMSNLPISTFALIGSSQLAFTAVFSLLLNGQKFTFNILNSVLLLILSTVILVLHSDGSSGSSGVSKGKYALGFICTLGSSAGIGLMLALSQFFFRKVIKDSRIGVVIKVVIYQYLVATSVSMIGLFTSGEWKGMGGEMREFQLGKVSYVMTIFWTTVCWEMQAVGSMGLVFEVSSLFTNVVGALNTPLIQVLSVITFHDKMTGLKAISLVLAIWGFVSYTYQHYIDDYCKPKVDQTTDHDEAITRDSSVEEIN